MNADRLSHNVPVYINGSTPDRSLFDALERAYAFIQTDAPTQPTGRSAPASNGHARNHPVQTAFDFGTPDAGPGAADRRGRDRGRGRDQRYSRYDDEGDED